ncbi:16S rRNA (cytidine(1402)-2'-O)-methyltransferase [Pseudalkalibacillus caeni]|uniref:Ribosomal RNA small subunit methyltransferase I n=1 Tax=Exobacillus caeni TaxID=2574798 RepID=A0A5R9EVL9_9BACL|nr:16S rRNA (cytidine(1402)-2'-O)-methyltransferase [Pseudalkalibacillus caeni]TLS35097.1 16S rRNA (cytidine(1402)-2'-O)-methyltransferase [Pseudalkalibacillus caeni]
MKTQQSYQNEHSGRLFLVPTPIGNLEDMTFRAIRTLKEADLIAAEDTRQTKKLTNHFEIETPLTSYHEHNKEQSGNKLIAHLKEGKTVALVSDAGMPAISDPGFELVTECIEQDIPVIPLPGPNAALTSLIASGLPTNHFYYFGFLSRQKKGRKQELESIRGITSPIIFYEAPHRLKETLKAIKEVYGNRKISISRELTKRYEEFLRGSVEEAIKWSEENELRGEFCFVLQGAQASEIEETVWWADLSVLEHINYYMDKEGLSSKEAIKNVAKERGLPKREVYSEYHIDG